MNGTNVGCYISFSFVNDCDMKNKEKNITKIEQSKKEDIQR